MAPLLNSIRTAARPGTGLAAAVVLLALGTAIRAQETAHKTPVAADAYRTAALPFLVTHCVKCHGEDKAKGDIVLHAFAGDPSAGQDLERWELVLEMLRTGEMPPEEEPQPTAAERLRVANWIDGQLRTFVEAGDRTPADAVVRRLTNFEYQNTMRDLLGLELELADNLPEDPARPYRFQNTAHYLLMGLEQIDRYEENARRAMASVIVDPQPPKIHRTRRSWAADSKTGPSDPTSMQPDELGVFGNRNRTVANGMQVFDWPATGTFRIRVKASAILPAGIEVMPLRIMLGHDIVGVGVSTLSPACEVGTLRLTSSVDEPKIYELTGRIENFPSKPEHRFRRGGKIDGRLIITAPHFTVTPVNVYDDGTLNDKPDPLAMPRAVVEWLEFEAPLAETWPPEHHTRILFDSPQRATAPSEYVREVLRRFLPRAFRRPVAVEEVERFAQIHAIVAEQLELKTLEESMRETLTMALLSPEFLYHRVDAGHPQYELASRLSYFLWGSMPDAALFALASAGQLEDPEVIASQVRRMLQDPRATDFLDSFVTQWFGLARMRSVPIDLERFPRFLYTIQRGEQRGQEVSNRPTIRDAMHAETVAFVHELIQRNASLLQLVDSDFAMLNQPLAAHYGVDGVQGHELRAVSITPEHHLGGVLTHGSVLIGTSTGSAPHPVYRAVWLREAILGDHVPDPPADVPALEDSVGDAAQHAVTLKDVLRLHRQKESCRDCHSRLDPWGIPFEQYDATGRFRPLVPPKNTVVAGFDATRDGDLKGYWAYLKTISTIAVEADAKLPRGPEVDGLDDLKRYLLEFRTQAIAENVVRRLLTYALGRELTYRDRDAVKQLLRAAEQNDYKLQDLIVAVCQAPLFTGRRIK